MTGSDVVLRGGRVIDPESGLDAIRDVAVTDGRIAAVGTGLPQGRTELDVAGQVVTAGFIDLHSHVNDLGGLRLQAMDGVTTALELEAGATPVAEAYRRAAAQGRPVNYGFAASWAMARMDAVAGQPPEASLSAVMARISDPAWPLPPSATTHPRTAGTFGRSLRLLTKGWSGSGGVLGLASALAKCSWVRPGCSRTGSRPCGGRAGCSRTWTPTWWCSIRSRSPTRPPTGKARARRPESGMSWWTGPSWCATARSYWTPGLGGRYAPNHAELH